jgi:hypothetical protein
MPSVDEIRTLTIKAISEGIDQTVADLNKLSKAQGDVAVVSDTSSKASTSVSNALQKQQMSLDTTYRAQQQHNTAQLAITRGYNEGMISLDRYNQLSALNTTRLNDATVAHSKLQGAMSGVSGQLVAMAAGAGPVGIFLAALGPWGVVAALGLTAVAAAFAEAQRTTQLLAVEAVSLEKFKETTGLSTDALQALTQAAARHGVQADQTMAAIVRFTTSWEQARLGGGAFLTQLQKIDPGLADQMQRTKDVAAAIDLYVLAIQKADAAGDIAARNQLMRAGGGRGGVAAFTGVANAITDAGGLAGLTQNAVDAGKVINDSLLKEIQILKAQLDETTKHADLMMGSIGAKPILETGLAWQKMREQVAGVLSDIANGTSTLSPWSAFLFRLSNYAMGPDTTAKVFGLQAGGGGMGQPALNQMPTYGGPLDMMGTSPPIPQKDIKAQLADMKEYVTLLGSGATEADKLKLKLLELQANVDGNATAENKYAAAIGKSAAELDAYIAVINLHNAALGVGATVSDTVAAKMAALAKQQQQGAGLTNDQIANSKRLIQAQADGAYALQGQIDSINVQARSFNMAAGAAETFRVVQTKINENLNAGKPAMDGVSAAFLTMANNAGVAAQNLEKVKIDSSISFGQKTSLLTSDDVQIAQQLKGLYGTDIPAAMASSQAASLRLNSAMSSASQAISGGLVTALTDITMGTKTAAQSFKDFSLIAIGAIEKMIIQLMIVGPLMRSLQGGLGGIFPGLGIGATAAPTSADFGGAGVGSGGFNFMDAAVAHTGGMVGSLSDHRYIHPAYFDDAPHFGSGGIVSGEVPIIAHKGEGVFTPGQMAAMGGSSMQNTFHINVASDATSSDPQAAATTARAIRREMEGLVNSTIMKQMRPGGILRPN